MRRILCLAILCAQCGPAETVGEALRPWFPGYLDIHQIQTGRGNAAFLIFPDGTTMLLDAGGVPDRSTPDIGPVRPNASRSPGEWIAQYIQQFSPRTPATLDYALITHYHDDHMGAIATVSKLIPIRTLLDRGASPAPEPSLLVDQYQSFRDSFSGQIQTVRAGRNDQIVAMRTGRTYPGFEVRNVAANGEVWTGSGSQARSLFPSGWQKLPKEGRPDENIFSIALRIRDGRFSWFSGGDLRGVVLDNLPSWQDLETPVAKAVGPVDALVLDHHGWLDSTNAFFLATLRPRVVVIPAWHASHPDHGVLRRVLSPRTYPGPRDIFITTLLDAPRQIFGYLGQPFASTEGHILIRVEPGGERYRVLILDDSDESHRIVAIHGPYESR